MPRAVVWSGVCEKHVGRQQVLVKTYSTEAMGAAIEVKRPCRSTAARSAAESVRTIVGDKKKRRPAEDLVT